MDLIVKHGTIVTASDVYPADLGVKDGKIAQIGGDLPADGARVVDAAGCYVIPGGVDVHTHLDTPSFGAVTVDDYRTGTIAAACGGTTSIVDFCHQNQGQTLSEALAGWHAKAEGKAAIDYGFHSVVTDMTDEVFDELATLPEQGVTSFKLFMAYKYMSMIDDLTLIRAMEQAKQAGATVMVHAENGDAAYYLQKKFVAEGKTAPKYHATTRPPRVEAEATARSIALAEIVGAPLYVVHLTCREALEEVMRGRMRGVDVVAETCTQYLYITEDDLDRPEFEGAKFVFTPPARTREQHEVLWRALADGALRAVSSDHSPWNFNGQKDIGRDDFSLIPNGAPGIEERLMMVYQGVAEGRLSLSRFVDVVATSPARIFGLYPQKGTIAVGSDADLVVWDPNQELTLTQPALHSAIDYSLYEGRTVHGVPRTVTLRGEVIVENREYVGQPGTGRFLHRAKHGEQLGAPAPESGEHGRMMAMA
ncbi:MAG: dihydropyrimidinase [Thermomicrobiales bacterium]|nr:dihydropyrimidinase [Thermomicrobiales bacterium]